MATILSALTALRVEATERSPRASETVNSVQNRDPVFTLLPERWMTPLPGEDDWNNLPIDEKRKKALEEISHGIRDATSEARIKAANVYWDTYMLNLPDAQMNELVDYTFSTPYNYDLRNGTKHLSEKTMRKFLSGVGDTDKALAGRPADADYIASRGVNLRLTPAQFADLRGRTLTDKAYLSTTLSDAPPEEFSKQNASLRLRVPRGTPSAYLSRTAAVSFYEDQEELLLGRGTAINVTRSFCGTPDASVDGGCKQWEIFGEVALQSPQLTVEPLGETGLKGRAAFPRTSDENWVGVVPKGQLPTEGNVKAQQGFKTAVGDFEFKDLPPGEYTVHVYPDKVSYAPLISRDVMVGTSVLRSVRQREVPEISPGGIGTLTVVLDASDNGRQSGKYVITAPQGFAFTDSNVVTRRPDGTDVSGGWTLSSDKRTLTNTSAWWDTRGARTLFVGLVADRDMTRAGFHTAEGGLSFAVDDQPPVTGDVTVGVPVLMWRAKQTVVPEIKPGGQGNAIVELDATGARSGDNYALNRIAAPDGFTFTDNQVVVKGPGGAISREAWTLTTDRTMLINLTGAALWRAKGTWTLEVSLTAAPSAAMGTHTAKDGLSFTTGGGLRRATSDLSATVIGN
jgi:hypothetical protein